MTAILKSKRSKRITIFPTARRKAWDARAHRLEADPGRSDFQDPVDLPLVTLKPPSIDRRSTERRRLIATFRAGQTMVQALRLTPLLLANQFPTLQVQSDSGARARMAGIRGKARRMLPDLLGDALPDGSSAKVLLPLLEPLIDPISDLHFKMGQLIAPFYAQSNDRLIGLLRAMDLLQHPDLRLTYPGRDSMPLLVDFRRRLLQGHDLPEPIHTPFSRLNIIDVFAALSRGVEHLRADLDGFYLRRDLAGKIVVVGDPGWNGTLERIHQMLLSPELKPRALIHMMIAILPRDLADQFAPFIPPEQVNWGADDGQQENLFGLLGWHYGDPHLMSFDPHFLTWLFGVGSGVNEAREHALRPRPSTRGGGARGSNDYDPDAALSVIGRLAFLSGFHHASWHQDATHRDGTAALLELQRLWRAHGPFFDPFQSQDDRADCTTAEVELTERLLNAGLSPALPRTSASTTWTQAAAAAERAEDERAGRPLQRNPRRFRHWTTL